MLIQDGNAASMLLEKAAKQYNEWVNLKPGQIIYYDPSKFIIPDYGDDSEEYW